MDFGATFGSLLVRFMLDVLLLAGVPLAVATLMGLIISFFQAVTQIQDQTLSQTVKIASIAVVLLAAGTSLAGPLMTSTREIFNDFDVIVGR
ncbi:flagellar biosynthetic protein FliQ [Yoonia sp.]|uniref:EscS/YscS/HrcS family type III secretion system export apparatus protein n=1 Tax=Yoonia sp. TaxID=2212373 RepID=UPI0025FC9468|nr:flagellar biosynthetic protein FliQ [Yoonia sp.]